MSTKVVRRVIVASPLSFDRCAGSIWIQSGGGMPRPDHAVLRAVSLLVVVFSKVQGACVHLDQLEVVLIGGLRDAFTRSPRALKAATNEPSWRRNATMSESDSWSSGRSSPALQFDGRPVGRGVSGASGADRRLPEQPDAHRLRCRVLAASRRTIQALCSPRRHLPSGSPTASLYRARSPGLCALPPESGALLSSACYAPHLLSAPYIKQKRSTSLK